MTVLAIDSFLSKIWVAKYYSVTKVLQMTISATVTSKGQTTIPKQFREKYGIAVNGRVTWVETPGGLLLQSATSAVDEVFGSLKSGIPMLTAKQEREAAAKGMASKHTESKK